jgi:Flp pilus assembly pilin Flp
VYRSPSGTALAKAAGSAEDTQAHTRTCRSARSGTVHYEIGIGAATMVPLRQARVGVKERKMRELIARLVREDEGQDLVEYVLLISLIGLALIASFDTVRGAIARVFTSVNNSLP